MDEKTLNSIVEAVIKGLDFSNVISEALKPINERLEKLETKEVDFSSVNDKLAEIEKKFEVKPEGGAGQPKRKTDGKPVGKEDEISASEKLAKEIEKIDNDKFLSASEKLNKKMEFWRKSMKDE